MGWEFVAKYQGVILWGIGFLLFVGFGNMIGRPMANSAMRSPAMGCQSNLHNLAIAAIEYQEKHEGEFPESLEDLTPDFFQKLPSCPWAENGSGYVYMPNKEHKDFEIRCTSEHSSWLFWSDELNYAPKRFRYFGSKGRNFDDEIPEWAGELSTDAK